MHALIRSAVAALSDWRLLALHLAGNALLLAAATLWLLIPEAHAWQLLVTALGGLAVGFTFVWLHCGTLAHGLTPVRETLGSDFRASIRHITACAVFFVVLIVLMMGEQLLGPVVADQRILFHPPASRLATQRGRGPLPRVGADQVRGAHLVRAAGSLLAIPLSGVRLRL